MTGPSPEWILNSNNHCAQTRSINYNITVCLRLSAYLPDAREPVLNQVEVRLVDIKTESSGVRGRVEVRRRDLYTGVRTQWGTVCDDFIDYQEVGVLCNMMGYR